MSIYDAYKQMKEITESMENTSFHESLQMATDALLEKIQREENECESCKVGGDEQKFEWLNPNIELPSKDGVYLCTQRWTEDDEWSVDTMEYGTAAPDANGGMTEGRIYHDGKGFGEMWHNGIDNIALVKAWAFIPEPCREDW